MSSENTLEQEELKPSNSGELEDDGLKPSDKFADVELIEAMKNLGFELSHHEGITDWFVKDEGTSELTVFGAREMLQLIQQQTDKARIDEMDHATFYDGILCYKETLPNGDTQWTDYATRRKQLSKEGN